jgi:glycosyltransferase involved in cell wall biosynthesis
MPSFRNQNLPSTGQTFTMNPNIVGRSVAMLNNHFSKKGENLRIDKKYNDNPRVINYCADQGGCAFWRLIFPTEALLAYKRATSMLFYSASVDPMMFVGVDAVKLQRQVSKNQLNLTKRLKQIQNLVLNKTGKTFKIIWEVDDIVYPKEDIPEFNAVKDKWLKQHPDGAESVKEIIHLCDEVCVVSDFMRSHYQRVIGYDKISVIPNYMPRNWIDGFYDEERIMQKYDRNKKRPTILYNGSATHFDVANRNNQIDDFYHMTDYIRKRSKDYQFVFFGGIPLTLKDLVIDGTIKYEKFGCILDYPRKMHEIQSVVNFASLANNNFNRAKSSLKLYEAGAMGIPCVAQDLECYSEAAHKFTTADEMDAQIQMILESENSYSKYSKASRQFANGYWLADHLDEHVLMYNTDYKDLKRKGCPDFLKNNPKQFTA